ncbi:MAG: U32 family peptidase, partial [Paramuribaculum sp.]|nr:U32 family peptidase [Paramuribaculum sp.]
TTPMYSHPNTSYSLVTVLLFSARSRCHKYDRADATAYSEAIESICDGSYTEDKIEKWTASLRKIFNRGFWDGYYLGQRLGEWSSKYGSSAERVKRYAAKGVRYFSNIGVAEFYVEAGEVKAGDEIVITGPTTGAIVMKLD